MWTHNAGTAPRLRSRCKVRNEPGPHPGASSFSLDTEEMSSTSTVPVPGSLTWMCKACGDMNDWATNPGHHTRLSGYHTGLFLFTHPQGKPHWRHNHPQLQVFTDFPKPVGIKQESKAEGRSSTALMLTWRLELCQCSHSTFPRAGLG